MSSAFALLREAFAGWNRRNGPRLGAALSYYTLFSMAPLIVIAISLAGLVFGEQAAQGRIVEELRGLVGEQGARAVEAMVENSRQPKAGILASAIALLTLVMGATGVFAEIKGALDDLWGVPLESRPSGIMGLLRDRLLSLAMVMAIGFLLLVSLLVSAALAALQNWLARGLPGWETVLWLANTASSFAVITALFALIFKLLPDTSVAWKDVWVGAVVTSAAFTLGKSLIGLYLGTSSISSVYGAAGSVVVLIVWVYYAAQIFYFGAEVTRAYADRHGSRVGRPAAVRRE